MLTRIGKYEIQSEIGGGGFGKVYLAHDPSVDRQVAVKILTSISDPDILGQFRGEAKTTGNLRHKNIVTVYDFGEHQGVPYLVMELLEGETLECAIRSRKAISLIDKLQLLQQTAEGLHYAHQMGVIHRDVKPANIMLLPNGSVKIMDFGIASLTELSASRHTTRSAFTGTSRYMAPEQFTGAPADVQTDIFAFGLVCYECISGSHPFEKGGESRITFRMASLQAEPLSRVSQDCPENLSNVIQRAISPDRESRYQSLEDVLLDFQPVLLEIRRQQAAKLMEGIGGLAPSDDSERVRATLKQVLELDPAQESARKMLEQLREDERKAALRRIVDDRLQQADARIRERDYLGAISNFESALRVDPSCEEAKEGLASAQALLQSSRASAKLRSSARFEASSGSPARATELVEEALRINPEDKEAMELLREYKVSSAIQRSQEFRKRNEFDSAEAAITDLGELSQELAALKELSVIRRQRSEEFRERRRVEFEAKQAAIQSARQNHEWTQALTLLDLARRELPEHEEQLTALESQIREEQAAARRAGAIAAVLEEASRQLRADSPDLAAAILEPALRSYPRERSLLELKERVRARQEEKARAEAVRAGEALVEHAIRSGEWDDALEQITALCKRWPGHPPLEALRNTATAEHRKQRQLLEEKQRQLISQRIAETDLKVQAERGLDRRVRILEEAAKEFPGEAHFARALQNARDKQDTASGIIARARAYEKNGQFTEALAQWETLRGVHPEYPGFAIELDRLTRLREESLRHARITRTQQLVERGRAAIQASNFDSALAALREALELDSGNPELRELLVRALVEQAQRVRETDSGRSLNLLREALALEPGHPLATSLMRRIQGQRQPEALNGIIARIQQLQEHGYLAAAYELVTDALTIHGNEGRLLELQNSLQRGLRDEPEIEKSRDVRQARTAVPAKLLYVGAGIAAVALLGFILFFRANRTPPAVPKSPPPPAANLVRLSVTTTPADAAISVDGNAVGNTAAALELNEKPGAHTFEARKPGYKAFSQTMQIAPGMQPGVTLNLILEDPELHIAGTGTVRIDDNQTVDVNDGQPALTLKAGDHAVRFATGTGRLTFKVNIDADGLPTVTDIHAREMMPLIVSNFGRNLRLYGSNATPLPVYLGNRNLGVLTPAGLNVSDIPKGETTLLVGEGNDAKRHVIETGPARTLAVQLEADLNVGTVAVTGPDVTVVLLSDGKEYRRVQMKGGQAIFTARVRTYIVRFLRNGSPVAPEQTFTLAKGQTQSLHFTAAPLTTAPRSPAAVSLRVHAAPGVLVMLDGGNRTLASDQGELVIPNVTPGTHTLEVVAGRYKAHQTPVVVSGSQKEQTVSLGGLELAPGTVHIRRDPATAQITYTARPGNSSPETASGNEVALTEGDYEFTAKAAGYVARTQNVRVNAGETTGLDLALTPEVRPSETGSLDSYWGRGVWEIEPSGSYVHQGDALLPRSGPADIQFQVVLGSLSKHRLVWVTNYSNSTNGIYYELTEGRLTITAIKGDQRLKVLSTPVNRARDYSVTLEVRPDHVRVWFGGVNVATVSGEALAGVGTGKFGFIGNKEVRLVRFSYVSR